MFLIRGIGLSEKPFIGVEFFFSDKGLKYKKYRFKTQTSLMLFFKCFCLLIYSPNTFYTFHNAYLFYVI